VTRYTTEVQATDFTFLSNKGGGDMAGSPMQTGTKPNPASEPKGNTGAPVETPEEDDDLPF
jgi:single-strand DNA-binding protein